MQFVGIVECLKHVRSLAAKAGAVAVAAASAAVVDVEAAPSSSSVTTGDKARGGGVSVAGPSAVKVMEELAHALGALEALLAEGAGDTSASGKAKLRMNTLQCLANTPQGCYRFLHTQEYFHHCPLG